MIKFSCPAYYAKCFDMILGIVHSIDKNSTATFSASKHSGSLYHAGRPIAIMFTETLLTCPDELNRTLIVTLEVVTEFITTRTSFPIGPPVFTGVAVTIGGYLNSESKGTVYVLVIFPETVSFEIASIYVA